MARVWIVNPFDPLPGDPEQPGRYATLAVMLREAGHEVTWWTASFSHRFKRPVECGPILEACNQVGIRVRFIDVPAYHRNVSLQRVRSHRVYARTFERSAREEPEPRVIIASNPPLESAAAAGRVAGRLGARFVVDVQDIWIETSRQLLPGAVRWASDVLFCPWRRANRKAYSAADVVVGVAGGYADEPKRYGRLDYRREVIPIGIDLASFDGAVRAGRCLLGTKSPGEVWAIYSGSLSRNYDVLTVAEAAARSVRQHPNLRCIFSGRGDMESQVRGRLDGVPRVAFLGFAPFEDWSATVSRCDIGWNAVRPEARVFLPNKVFYYWAAGLAVLNTIPGECADWIARTGTGISYQAGDADAACGALDAFVRDSERLRDARQASRRIAEQHWDRRLLYRDYVGLVNQLAT